MKKIALAIAMATSASFASAQLTFDPNSTNGAQQSCDFDGSFGVFSMTCSTASQSFGQDAYNAYNAVGESQDDVNEAQAILDAANAADPAVPADIQAATDDLLEAQADLDTAETTFASFEDNGIVAAGAVNVAQAESEVIVATDAVAAQSLEVDSAQQAVNDAQINIDNAEIVRDQEFADFTAASDLVAATDPNDPNYDNYVDDKSLQALEYLTASSAVDTAEAALDQPMLDLDSAQSLLTENQEAETEAIAARDQANIDYADVINDWENNLDSAVLQAALNEANSVSDKDAADQALANAESDLSLLMTAETDAETAEAAAENLRDDAQGIKDNADADLVIKEQAVDDAEDNLANAQTPQETQDATEELQQATNARDASQEAVNNAGAQLVLNQTAYDDAIADTQTAVNNVLAQDVIVADRQDDVEVAIIAVETSQAASLVATNEQAASEAYSGENANSPANALLTSLVNDADHAEAIVAAVSDTFVATETNADAIAVNEEDIAFNTGRIETNETNIASNTGRIETNETNIVSNTGRIETNETNIASNTGRIETNETNIASNTGRIETNETNISSNTGRITSSEANIVNNSTAIGVNASAINDNGISIGRLSEELDVVRSGVAATLAVAGMPLAPTEGWGAAIGTGYFDGESAVAAGLTFRSDRYNFKFAVGTSGGETTGSAGVSWGF
jgi:ECM component-binding autotransporter adhesin